MPLLDSNFTSHKILTNGHLSTIASSLLPKSQVIISQIQRERLVTLDNDFVELDWLRRNSQNLILFFHGLEGSSRQPYILRTMKGLMGEDFDLCSFNFRSCSGVKNRTARLYHSGDTEDVKLLIQNILKEKKYKSLYLVGFSMGGNIILKYLSEVTDSISQIKKAIVFSVPLDLEDCSSKLTQGFNRIYTENFLISLRNKISSLKENFHLPYLQDINLSKLKDFYDFDEFVTAPMFGFDSARDYWNRNSSLYLLDQIRIPTLLINAKNDPFLGTKCFPYQQLRNHSTLFFETPNHGGHVSFIAKQDRAWFSKRIKAFIFDNC